MMQYNMDIDVVVSLLCFAVHSAQNNPLLAAPLTQVAAFMSYFHSVSGKHPC